jgi:8-oxo-dGTP pyrophosphatase MutT (NUDIX family)
MSANMNCVYGCIFMTNKNTILMVKGRSTKKWSFPKGHPNKGETGYQVAQRETFEETGLYTPSLFKSIVHLKTGTYYIIESNEQRVYPRDITEIEEVAWVPISKISSLNVNIDVNTFIREHLNTQCIQKKKNTLPLPPPCIYVH